MGFIASALGAKNDYQATPAQLQTTDYGQAIQQALGGNAGQGGQARGQQEQLVAALTAAMNGQGPSLAQNMLTQATNQNTLQGASLLGSQRGINPALAARQIVQNTAAANQSAAGQGATLRATEQLGAMGQLGNVLSGVRGQDINQVQADTGRVGVLGGLQNAQNNSNISNQLGVQQINADTGNKNAGVVGNLVGGSMNAGASVLGSLAMAGAAARGGVVPGGANVPGDSPANDTELYALSPGEVVVPRSVAKNSDEAKEFIKHVKAAGKAGTTTERNAGGYASVVAAQRQLHARLQRLEALAGGN